MTNQSHPFGENKSGYGGGYGGGDGNGGGYGYGYGYGGGEEFKKDKEC